ncbi:uncharacterized protein BJX67DRAFT_385287 [Aspergillus lucknowensis]|uniref:Uncharacterized protein n=1 Tax=Aspergillus lucknowensis TaxID=176173 RepID=A0ABR4LHA7_9EURO
MESPVFFETCWGILSTIGIFLVFASVSVILITNNGALNFVPLVVSASCAIANGLCYYAYYTRGPPKSGLVVASIFADIFWMIQEVGLSFYNYQILKHILRHRARTLFLVVFWALIVAIVGIRITITVSRATQLADGDLAHQKTVNHLHTGYFVSIALLETWSAVFLIRQMARARFRSPQSSSVGGVFQYLLRSAELRLATLCCIGISRAVTYSSQEYQQKATTVASQVDRFVYTVECLFPVIFLLDILGAKRYRQNNVILEPSSVDLENSSALHHPHWISSSPPKSRDTTSDQVQRP